MVKRVYNTILLLTTTVAGEFVAAVVVVAEKGSPLLEVYEVH